MMMTMAKTRWVLLMIGHILNEAASFILFSLLDIFDIFLCLVYRAADFIFESECKPCYCSSPKEAITGGGKILVSEKGESKILCVASTRLRLDEISDTLYARPSVVNEISKWVKPDGRVPKKGSAVRPTFTVNATIVEMLQEKINGGRSPVPVPRWSDCDCKLCNSWCSSEKQSLFVRVQEPEGFKKEADMEISGEAREDVVFIHGFISSSAFWTETVFGEFSDTAKERYRLMAVDLLGFGRSPKPAESLYTLKEHVEMIERSVMEPYKVKSFHIVAHSLGCILALALAVKYPGAVKSLTMLAPPYYPVPNGEQGNRYVMRKVAPRRVWPPMALGSSIACWYEHISRTVCLLICRNHRFWEFLTKLLTRNRVEPFLLEGFFSHTHNAAWHTLHNVICGSGGKMDKYLDAVRDRLKCSVNVFHGKDDEVIPLQCSLDVKARVPRARVKVLENKDHITIVLGRRRAFAAELEEIWKNSSNA